MRTTDHQQCFEEVKEAVANNILLEPYEPSRMRQDTQEIPIWPKFETTFRDLSSNTQESSNINPILSSEEMKTLGNMRKWPVDNFKKTKEGI